MYSISEYRQQPWEHSAAYSKKSGENTSVIAMIDLLITDLNKEMTEA